MPRFDIFAGSIEILQWVESVANFSIALQRMKSLAEGVPGQYFVYSHADHKIVSSIDTSQVDSVTSEIEREGENPAARTA